MGEDWLAHKHRIVMNAKTTQSLVALRGVRLPLDNLGLLMRGSGPDGSVLTVIAPNFDYLKPEGIARLIALAMIDSQVTLLYPTFMPFRHAHAFVKTNGGVRHQLIRSLPEWSLDECERLANVLQNDHGTFITDFIGALLDESDTSFPPPPSDSPILFSPGEAFSFDPPSADIDTSGFNRQYGGLERHIVIRLEYERDRYMEHLSHIQLMQRINDIMRNIHQVDEKGRITLDTEDSRLYYWMDRFTEAHHEAQLRQIPKDVLGQGATKDYPFPAGSDRPKRIGMVVAETDIPDGHYLVRYGRYEHIKEAYDSGHIRLGPAASYDDPSLNPARQDEELVSRIDIDTDVFRVFGPRAINIGRRHPIMGTFDRNFYILCCSSSLRERLFLDFNADACLLITNPDMFKERLLKGISQVLPGYSFQAERVEYYDPLWVSPTEIRPIFWKHFRHAYQEEIRFAAIPPEPVKDLEPVYVSLGCLENIATIVDAR